MIKIKVKTDFIELECSDEYVHDSKGYTSHGLPELIVAVKSVINDCVEASVKIINAKSQSDSK